MKRTFGRNEAPYSADAWVAPKSNSYGSRSWESREKSEKTFRARVLERERKRAQESEKELREALPKVLLERFSNWDCVSLSLVAMRGIQSSWSLSKIFARRVRSLCEKLMVSLCEGVRYARGTF
ncbi:hypothetical protein LR48_Vigan02g102000 [Vigna angularis]|uniref:Uncharacterized protein n=1 Tax=Phaseolus angularis TaxID=3914 RepID=A0A0L9TWE4_PHAAN|nr:hypothetical protein LR48_Vigan02g102000 [Vigna angularis]